MDRVPIETLKYFSQHGEDQLLWEFFDFKHQGCFIDVGAFDGVYLSNSFSFYLAGWRGVCVEPHVRYFEFMQERRPDDTCVRAVCGDRSSPEVDFYSEELGLYSTRIANAEVVEEIAARYAANGLQFNGLQRSSCQMVTLDELACQIPEGAEIDFVSVDVEGAELAVLEGSRKLADPRVWIVESNRKEEEAAVYRHLADERGYTLARRVGVNSIYTRSADDAIRMRSIPIRYAAEKMLHPLGADYTLDTYRRGHIVDEPLLSNLSQQTSEATRLARREHHLVARVEKLSRRRDELEKQAHTQQRRLHHVGQRIEQLSARRDDLRKVVARQERRIAHLGQRISAYQKSTTRLELGLAALTTFKRKIAALQTRLGQYELRNQSLVGENQQQAAEQQRLERKVSLLRARIDSFEDKSSDLERQVAEMQPTHRVGRWFVNPITSFKTLLGTVRRPSS